MKILIYGFGRMGLTHYAILNSLIENANFSFVEPNRKLNFLLRKNISANFYESDTKINEQFDLTLITTPPFAHKQILENRLEKGDTKIFIEKPFGGHNNCITSFSGDQIFIGYVLRFNKIINWVKTNIDPKNVAEVNASYLSNTIVKKPDGWRNGKFSGVLNEMGSHIIDLSNYLFDLSDAFVSYSKVNSVISDVDDIVLCDIEKPDLKLNLNFNWIDKSIRKPFFSFRLKMKDGSEIYFDQQMIEKKKANKTLSKLYVTSLTQNLNYYLRGVDFTLQMDSLINNPRKLCGVSDALLVNKLMNNILNK